MIINYSNEKVKINKENSIFLAGPTPRDKETISWRKDAIRYLEEKGYKGLVYYPEDYIYYKDHFDDQVEWERFGLLNSTVILFWIPRELNKMPGFTTNVEFGYWLAKTPNKIIYGRPDDAVNIKYLDWLYNKETSKKICTSLEKTIDQALLYINDNK